MTSPRMQCQLRRVAIEMEMGVFALTDIHLSYNQYKRDYSSNHRGNSFRSRDGIIGRKCLRSDRSKPYQTSFTRCISIDAVTVRTLANRHTHACLRSASRWINRCVLQTLHASIVNMRCMQGRGSGPQFESTSRCLSVCTNLLNVFLYRCILLI